MTEDPQRNFRSAYYEKVGFRGVEEKKSLEILLKDNPLGRLVLMLPAQVHVLHPWPFRWSFSHIWLQKRAVGARSPVDLWSFNLRNLHFLLRPGKAEYLQSEVPPPVHVQDPRVEGVAG